jgi:D-xylose transport system ATP-binding protein
MNNPIQKNIVLKAEGITKYFGSVLALDNVNIEVYEDEVIGLVGDNGAGKSTLIKILSGNFPPDKGTLYLDGNKISFKSPSDARKMGIETVYQDLALCEQLDAVSNLFIGRELQHKVFGVNVLQKREMEKMAVEILGKIGTDFPSVREKVFYMSGGQRQAVALGRFIAWGQKLILLDEPTAALGVRETSHVLTLVAKTRKEKGVSMILIIVMRHGEVVGVREKKNTNPDEIVSMITGSILVNQEGGK